MATFAESTVVPDVQADVVGLFEAHGAPLYRFCRSMLGSNAESEDVVQDTFVKLLRHLETDGDRTNLRAWLFTVAANACRDVIRQRSRWLPWRPQLDRRTVGFDAAQPDLQGARRALSALPVRDRMLLSLRAQGLSYAEIARASGVNPVSVGRLLARAIDRWKQELAKETNHGVPRRPPSTAGDRWRGR